MFCSSVSCGASGRAVRKKFHFPRFSRMLSRGYGVVGQKDSGDARFIEQRAAGGFKRLFEHDSLGVDVEAAALEKGLAPQLFGAVVQLLEPAAGQSVVVAGDAAGSGGAAGEVQFFDRADGHSLFGRGDRGDRAGGSHADDHHVELRFKFRFTFDSGTFFRNEFSQIHDQISFAVAAPASRAARGLRNRLLLK